MPHSRPHRAGPRFSEAGNFRRLRAPADFGYTPDEHPGGRMEVHTFFLILLTILLAARILGEFAARLQAPPVIGELLAGILLGPSLLGWIEPPTVIKPLAELR